MADNRNHIHGLTRIGHNYWPPNRFGQVDALTDTIRSLLNSYAERGGPLHQLDLHVTGTADGSIVISIDGDKGER